MPITEKQRLKRTSKLGSSDAPAILNVSPWRTATDVYWSKLTPNEQAAAKHMQTGNRLEAPLVDFACEELGVTVRRNQYRVSVGKDSGLLAANLDALVNGKREAVEGKYVGQSSSADWGQPGTDQVPDYVTVQVQHQMYVAELDRVWVPAAVAGYQLDWRLYCVPRHEELIRIIVWQEINFWRQHVMPRVPPTPSAPPLEVLQALSREPGSVILLDDQQAPVVEAYQHLGQVQSDSEKAKKKAKADLLVLLGEHEGARLPNGTQVTYLSQRSPPRCNYTRLQADHPEIYEEYVTEGTHRVLRIKEPKKEVLTDDRGHDRSYQTKALGPGDNEGPKAALEAADQQCAAVDGGPEGIPF